MAAPKKHLHRPRKSDTARQKRLRVQRRRLVGFGLSEAAVKKLDAKQIRFLLRRPKQRIKV
jgi:hypothetical protein